MLEKPHDILFMQKKPVVCGQRHIHGLLVTPDKTVLAGGGRKVLRFVLLKEPDAQEHIYRVTVKPVVNAPAAKTQVGLKVLIGYEVLVIIRPAAMASQYHAVREGKKLTVENTGNTSVLLQNGQQCPAEEKCALPPVLRVYPGQTASLELPLDKPVHYAVWDGKENREQDF